MVMYWSIRHGSIVEITYVGRAMGYKLTENSANGFPLGPCQLVPAVLRQHAAYRLATLDLAVRPDTDKSGHEAGLLPPSPLLVLPTEWTGDVGLTWRPPGVPAWAIR